MAGAGLTKNKAGKMVLADARARRDATFNEGKKQAQVSVKRGNTTQFMGTSQITRLPMGKDPISKMERNLDGAMRQTQRTKGLLKAQRKSRNKTRRTLARADAMLGRKTPGSRRYSRKTGNKKPKAIIDRIKTRGGTTKKLVRSFGAITSGRNNIRKFR